MDCKETNSLLTAYIDGEVTPDERKSIQTHLDACPLCRQDLDELAVTLSKVHQSLGILGDIAAPSAHLWADIRLGIEIDSRIPIKGGHKSMVDSNNWLRGLFSRRTWWKPVAIGATALALVVILTLALPPLFGTHAQVLASDLALSNPDVKTALNGSQPTNIGMTENIGVDGTTRVIMTLPPDKVIIADVDMQKQTVTKVAVQLAADVTIQQVVAVAQADPQVANLLEAGNNIYFSNAAQYDVSLYSQAELTSTLQEVGVTNPQDFYGLMGTLMLKVNPGDTDAYLVFVNMSLGKVVGIVANPFPTGTPPVTLSPGPTSNWELYK
jgi:hypothetical protein